VDSSEVDAKYYKCSSIKRPAFYTTTRWWNLIGLMNDKYLLGIDERSG
jgi:hypothetical protein